jgi:hypothetical protein
MRPGEVAGVVHVTGKPTDLLTRFKPEPGFHFLAVPFSEKRQVCYVPTKLDSHDYPNLIPAGQTVDTIGVANVLAVYNWPPIPIAIGASRVLSQASSANSNSSNNPPSTRNGMRSTSLRRSPDGFGSRPQKTSSMRRARRMQPRRDAG